MGIGITVSTSNNVNKVWRAELWKDVIDDLFFMRNGMMGAGSTNIVQLLDDLTKKAGDTVNISLTSKLTGSGVSGDNELEGSEEQISSYNEQIAIDQKRNAVRLTGKLDEQKVAYNMRTDAKEKLSIWMKEFIERNIFLKLAGVTNTSLTDPAGNTVGTDAAWSNTPDYIPDADTAAGTGSRYLCINTSGADSLSTSNVITPDFISKLKVKAQLASPMIRRLRVGGVGDYYVLFIHPLQAYDLKKDSTWSQANREARERGIKNPLFTNALGYWNGVVIYEHEYIPFLDISTSAGNSFRGAATGTDFTADTCRSLLCGQQAAAFARCKNPDGWVEKLFDYDNIFGVASGIIGGIQKVMFNSLEYGVIAGDTSVSWTNQQ